MTETLDNVEIDLADLNPDDSEIVEDDEVFVEIDDDYENAWMDSAYDDRYEGNGIPSWSSWA